MNYLLRDLVGKGLVRVYLDNIIIVGKNRNETIKACKEVLEILKREKFQLNKNKCTIFLEKLKVLGHISDKSGLHADSSKIRHFNSLPTLKYTKDIQKLKGEVGFLSKFIMNYIKITSVLSSLQGSKTKFKWEPIEEFELQIFRNTFKVGACLR